MTALTIAPSLGAQRSQLPASEIAHIADEVLRVVAPPQRALSGVPVASRQLALDLQRTLAAFGASAAAGTAVRLRREVTPASRSVLSDCSQMHQQPCARLGWRAYVWVELLSLAGSDAVVRANVAWVDRRPTPFVAGSTAPGRGYLEGFSTTLRLVRDSNGTWTFVKEEGTVTG